MKHEVAELEGARLDAAVAKAEGIDLLEFERKPHATSFEGAIARVLAAPWSPSTNWMQGGPIIERERIMLAIDDDSPGAKLWFAGVAGSVACSGSDVLATHGEAATGSTPLVAAMRAYVASKFGQEVDLP